MSGSQCKGVDLMRSLPTLVALFVLLAAPACAISVSVDTAGSHGAAAAHGTYSLSDDASFVSHSTLGDGTLNRQSAAAGTGGNMIKEGVSSGSGSVSRTVASDGALGYAASDDASGGEVASGMQASLSGSAGMFSTVSSGGENEMTVAGGFLGDGGDMSVSLTSVAADQAMTTGQASALGTQCFNGELTQGILGQDAAVSVHALYASDDRKMGEFGVIAQNARGKVATDSETSEPPYILTGYRWINNPGIDIIVSSNINDLPAGISADRVKSQIQAAEGTWDGAAAENLFDPVNTAAKGFNRNFALYSKRDGKNVHMWTSKGLSTNTIAMTVTWYTTSSKVKGADGNSYNRAVESDCWYNNRLNWRIDTSAGGGAGTNTYDIQTIALHELGHTLGLADLYADNNRDKIMYGYNDGTSRWTLGTGDIAGIQKLYGTPS